MDGEKIAAIIECWWEQAQRHAWTKREGVEALIAMFRYEPTDEEQSDAQA